MMHHGMPFQQLFIKVTCKGQAWGGAASIVLQEIHGGM
jgi:hypothetical protein